MDKDSPIDHTHIERQLCEIEREYGVTVLYAAEAGSRAWGFASRDSDFDIRFIYRYNDLRDVVRIDSPPDNITLEITQEGHVYDTAGWDLRKTLLLFRKSNPSLLEWLASPIIYREIGALAGELRVLASRYASLRAYAGHYYSMYRANLAAHLTGKERVPAKKYLYVFRPLICVLYLERLAAQPPVAFDELLAALDLPGPVLSEIEELIARKHTENERDLGPRLPAVDAFLAEEGERIPCIIDSIPSMSMPIEPLNEIYWRLTFGEA
jgi:predicted nucleotidyltransferase